jgi:hypothetical protein
MQVSAQTRDDPFDSSRRIAMDAKKDSSMMKSIALLTMVFLPATFLAVSLVPINIYHF